MYILNMGLNHYIFTGIRHLYQAKCGKEENLFLLITIFG